MEPVDFRNATWDSIQDRLQGLRLDSYRAWQTFGPGTTRDVSGRCGIDLLTFRPRTTELFQLGLLRLVNGESRGGEGIYQWVPVAVARAEFEKKQAEARDAQLPLL